MAHVISYRFGEGFKATTLAFVSFASLPFSDTSHYLRFKIMGVLDIVPVRIKPSTRIPGRDEPDHPPRLAF